MEENQDRKYYPTYFLLVTGFSFLLFALFSSLVEDENAKIFWWTGGSTFLLGLLTGVYIFKHRTRKRKNSNFDLK